MPAAAVKTIRAELPHKLGFLLDMHRYKVAYGGRGGGKSWAFADSLLLLGAAQPLRILCAREIQKSIEQSVHQLLKDRIAAIGLSSFYTVQETEIAGRNGTQIKFTGLSQHTADTIKSFEGVDICWVEEAQTVPKRSWDILTPTIRAENSEIWVTFNPDMESDEVWRRFIERQPTGAMVAKVNYYDNPWFPKVLEQERLDCFRDSPADYPNIWEGRCRTAVIGAIYGKEVTQAIEDGRVRPLPYDPRLPVHAVWDLGWNDAMSVIMVQKPVPSVVNIINYYEDRFQRYDEVVRDLGNLGYRWGMHYLPHDGGNENPQTGISSVKTLRNLGCRVAEPLPRSDPEDGIKLARMMFPRVYFDNTERKRDTGFLGVPRLSDCLKRYRRHIPKNTDEPASPVHDQFSHGADAFRYLAMCVDQMVNEGDEPPVQYLPQYEPMDAGCGALG